MFKADVAGDDSVFEMDGTGDPTVPPVGTVPVHAPAAVPLRLLVVPPFVPVVFIGETADGHTVRVLRFVAKFRLLPLARKRSMNQRVAHIPRGNIPFKKAEPRNTLMF